MQTWSDLEKLEMGKHHRVDQIPDLEDRDGNISLPKLVAYLTNFQKDISNLIDRSERIDFLIVKMRSSEAVTVQLTRDIETLRNNINEQLKRIDEIGTSLKSVNEKHAAHIFTSDQAIATLNQLAAAFRGAEEIHNQLETKIREVNTLMSENMHSQTNMQSEVSNLQVKLSDLTTKVANNCDTLNKFMTTCRTVVWVFTTIGGLVGVVAAVIQAFPLK